MYRILAITALIASAALAPATVHAGEENAKPESASMEHSDAITRAKQSLATHLGIGIDEIEVISVESKTWNDSSLGCGQPGTMAMQVLTPGHAVRLQAQGKEHHVHVAGKQAIVCDRPALSRKPGAVTRARGVEQMLQLAREDLAQQLGVDQAQIRVAGMKPHEWSDSAMECPIAGETVKRGPLRGYKLSLRYQQRIFTYHTDLSSVRACPPISRE